VCELTSPKLVRQLARLRVSSIVAFGRLVLAHGLECSFSDPCPEQAGH
jgi:hypothetical protein